MTVLTDTQVVTASGGLVELGYSQITSNVSVASSTAGTSATTVIPPVTVICDGGPVLVEFFAANAAPSTTSGDFLAVSLMQDGAEATRYWTYKNNNSGGSTDDHLYLSRRLTPTAGSHTFGVNAFVTSAARPGKVNASASTTSDGPAFLRVSKIVTATQWPAVTTGTIICTSSTRPGSPFEGQTIYETDTDLSYTYNGSAWVQTENIGAWTSFTPTWTGLSVGNAVQKTAYKKDGRLVTVRLGIDFGSTSTFSGTFTASLPVTAHADYANGWWSVGTAHLKDSDTSHKLGVVYMDSTTAVRFSSFNVNSTTRALYNGVSSTDPMTWTTNDAIYATFQYEAAS